MTTPTNRDVTKTAVISPAGWERLKEIVADALDLPTIERAAFLDAACAGDAALRCEAASLIDFDEEEAEKSDSCVLHPRVDSFLGLRGPDPSALAGRKFGKYQLVRLLGEGGMAAVYLAKQDGMERPVALKVLRPHALGYDAHRRFGREVAAQGRIDHPGVARIIDAGVERDAALPGSRPVPYIAMEYVDGLPLTKWATQKKLNLHDRMSLLADVADAVHAAHQRAIVHRDLKPGNVLVTENGGYGTPKVLDFGIARILQKSDEGELAAGIAERARTLQTTTGVLLGTLGYMAPEQARGGGENVDVRSDVWALGVMLHELVTGRMPVPVVGMPLTEALRRLSEPDITPASIGRIEGDADVSDLRAILTTTLAAEPARRYPSAKALAEDLRRLLRHEPVTAHLPTRGYIVRKFVRRHRAGVAAASLIALALVGGATAATIGFVREAAARKQAVDSEQDAIAARNSTEQALLLAEAQHLRSQAARGFLNHILEAADVDSPTGGQDVTLLEAIRAAEPDLPRFVQGDVVVESDVRLTLARALRSLGEIDDADAQYGLAIDAARQAKNPVTGEALETMWPIELLFERAQSLANQSQIELARPLYEEARRQLDGRPDKETDKWSRVTLEADKALAALLEAEGDYTGAADMWLQILPRGEALLDKPEGPESPLGVAGEELATMHNNAGSAMLYAGRIEEATALFTKAVEYRRQEFGETHPVTLRAMNNLANAYDAAGRLDDVEKIARQVIEHGTLALGPDHELVRSGRGTLISVQIQRQSDESLKEALELSEQSIAGLERTGRARTADMLIARNSRAIVLLHMKREEDAVIAFTESVALGTALFGDDHPFILSTRANLGRALADAGDLDGGSAQMRQVYEIQRQTLGEESQNTVITRNNLAMLAVDAGDAEGAAESAKELAQCVRIATESGWEATRPVLTRNYGRALLVSGQLEAAETQLLAAYNLSEVLGETHQQKAADFLVTLYETWGKPGSADEWRAKATPGPTLP